MHFFLYNLKSKLTNHMNFYLLFFLISTLLSLVFIKYSNYFSSKKSPSFILNYKGETLSFESAYEMRYFQCTYALHTQELFQLALKERNFYAWIIDIGFPSPRNQEKCNKSLTEYVEDYERNVLGSRPNRDPIMSLTEENEDTLMTHVRNPISMYKMIRRLHLKVNEILKHCGNMGISSKSFFGNIALPKKYDLEDAAYGIIRIVDTYRLDIYNFTQGIIGDFHTGVTLDSYETFAIAKFARRDRFYDSAILWTEVARILCISEQSNANNTLLEGNNGTANTTELDQILKDLHERHDKYWDLLYNSSESEFTYLGLKLQLFTHKLIDVGTVVNKRIRKLYAIRDDNVLYDPKIQKEYDERHETDLTAGYEVYDLCGGENHQKNRQRLKCWFDTSSHAYHRINPLKTEMLNEDPILIRLHDFISQEISNNILRDSESVLGRSGVVPQKDVDERVNVSVKFIRTSVNGWVTHLNHSYLIPLYKRIGFATGLNVLGTYIDDRIEDLQVAKYSALGSHYDVHPDDHVDYDEEYISRKLGFRQMTFMFYLNDVKMGGYTGFPYMGTAAAPIKGSAVYWYNFHPNITTEIRTSHAGCPVALGEKYIATKWISTSTNTFQKKCPLDKEKLNSYLNT